MWTASQGTGGYGQFGVRAGKVVRSHRFAYRELRGKIPEELVIDHLCRVRHCVNPWHLELVTTRENILRGEGASARNARKTHCDNGHLLRFLRGDGGCRPCMPCLRESQRRWTRAHPEYAKEAGRKFRTEHPEKNKAICAANYERNRVARVEWQRAYSERQRELKHAAAEALGRLLIAFAPVCGGTDFLRSGFSQAVSQ